MKSLYGLKDKLCTELDELAEKPDMSLYDLDTVHKLTDTIKNIDKIMMLEEGGYSGDGYSQAGGGRGGGGRGGGGNRGGGYSQEGGSSYAGGSSYGDDGEYSEARRKRDNRGRYSRDDGRGEMMNQLERMMSEARDPSDRERISRFMDEMRR